MTNYPKFGLGYSWEFKFRYLAFKSALFTESYAYPYSSLLVLCFYLPLNLKGFLLFNLYMYISSLSTGIALCMFLVLSMLRKWHRFSGTRFFSTLNHL